MAFLWLLSSFVLLGATFGGEVPASNLELRLAPMIINVKNAPPNSWPWHVIVQTPTGRPRCGGSLIYRNWVVTAAHCNVTTSDTVVAGLYDRRSPGDDIQILRIDQIFRHPRFDSKTHFADIALLKLSTQADFNENVSSVALPPFDERFTVKSPCKVVGWGLSHPNGTTTPHKLQEAAVELLNRDECKTYWGRMSQEMLCFGRKVIAIYNGDSGGSLVCKKDGVWTLMGVTACINEYCPTNTPMVAIRFPKYKPWVEYTTTNN